MVGASAQPDAWLATRTFLVWVAACNFVTVGSATYFTGGDSLATHVLAWIVALAAGVAAAFAIATLATWAGTPSALDRSHPNPERVQPEERASVAQRERQPERRTAERHLTEQLALGNSLRTHLQQAISDATPDGTVQLIPEIDDWIATTRALLDAKSPQLAQYFATDTHDMAEPNWPSKLQDAINLSQSGRLNRHLERLNEILRPSK
ncbi:MAG: hypothetical protein JWO17_882 [Actinomycetia bacterium]|nr:hypothetical protein [Actinomycetes bacterium]